MDVFQQFLPTHWGHAQFEVTDKFLEQICAKVQFSYAKNECLDSTETVIKFKSRPRSGPNRRKTYLFLDRLLTESRIKSRHKSLVLYNLCKIKFISNSYYLYKI